MEPKNNTSNSGENPSKGKTQVVNNPVRALSPNSKSTIQSLKFFSKEIENIKQQAEDLKQNPDWNKIETTLLPQIDRWEKKSIEKIQSDAKNVRDDLKQRRNDLDRYYQNVLDELSNTNNNKESDIERLKKLLENCQHKLQEVSTIKIKMAKIALDPLITIKNIIEIRKETFPSSTNNGNRSNMKPQETDKQPPKSRHESPILSSTNVPPPKSRYLRISFGVTDSRYSQVYQLFEHLQSLCPMEKNGSMSGDCDFETTQMEQFLSETFDFKNLPGKYIVQGVQEFQLDKPLKDMSLNQVIRFPSKTATAANSFAMSVDEIRRWQRSYAVYADRTERDINTKFLQHALRGHSRYGTEAFLMKFVVRISQCPILMEFDGKIISREPDQSWPNNIKLVSVTGIDFAGRIHDLDDIRTYVLNWRDIYEVDPQTDLPYVYHGRDFYVKPNAPRGQLNEQLLQRDLKRMARLRLRACDQEQVQIVVETGIGLGVFAGKYIGIDETVRTLSARAIRQVLEEDENTYRHILAVVFALPIFDGDGRSGRKEDTYQAFEDEFVKSKYQGRTPVLIIDQDMHRLTVAIARKNFRVSELNPADSHGVFGEYWQNRGPAVEEKLALTTVGLLVQHHLINPYVLDRSHYRFI